MARRTGLRNLDFPRCKCWPSKYASQYGIRCFRIFEYVPDPTDKSRPWKLWAPAEWKVPKLLRFSALLIPTMDSCRAEYMIDVIAKQEMTKIPPNYRSSLLVGSAGTAKTSTAKMFLNKYPLDVMLSKRINFSSATTPLGLQRAIEGEVERKTGKTFCPPGGKQLTVFLDDASMPLVNKWGDQVTNELTRQLIEFSGFYFLDRDKRGEFKKIEQLKCLRELPEEVSANATMKYAEAAVNFLVDSAMISVLNDNYEFCDLATMPNPLLPNGGAWCNGTLQGIIDQLDYIDGMGFECIWITPVVKSLDYTGYYAENFFDVDPHIGTKETLRELSRELHKRGMCLIVDIVANHVRPLVVQSDWSPQALKTYLGPAGIVPFDKEEYFHTYGKSPATLFRDYVLGGVAQASQSQGSDKVLASRVKQGLTTCGYKNMNLTECNCFPGNGGPDCPGDNEQLQLEGWFGQLADLNQDNEFVRQMLLKYVKYLVKEYDVDAFRLDTAIYMPKHFLKDLQEAAGVDILAETTVNNISYHAEFQEVLTGLLNFPAFYQVHASFCQYHLGGDLGSYHLQGAFTPELPDLRKLAAILRYQSTPGLYKNPDMLGNFADNHDEFARIAFYCDHDSYRIRNALALLFFARGTPIVYYGTEQGLSGHQANVLEKAALKKQGLQDKGQAFVRESMWQTRFNTSTWQYQYIKQLNAIRKEHGIDGRGNQEYVSADWNHLIVKRFPPGGGSPVWLFVNNNQNWTGESPFLYCPAPHDEEYWYDAFTWQRAFLRHGCFMAEDTKPKLLVRGSRFTLVKVVEHFSHPKHVWSLWVVLTLLCLTNLFFCWKCRRLSAKIHAYDDKFDSNDDLIGWHRSKPRQKIGKGDETRKRNVEFGSQFSVLSETPLREVHGFLFDFPGEPESWDSLRIQDQKFDGNRVRRRESMGLDEERVLIISRRPDLSIYACKGKAVSRGEFACAQKLGGLLDIPNRLKSKFFSFNMVLPSTVSADNIYGNILRARFNAKQGTSPGILSLTRNVTSATIGVWTKVQKVLLPTPSRWLGWIDNFIWFHYIFNLRELSRVFQVDLLSCEFVIVDEERFVSLWRHECTRVFADKLSREKEFLSDKPPATEDDEDPVAPKVYEPVQSLSHVSRKAYEYLARFNQKNQAKAMNLVLFEDAMMHLMRINRTIRQKRGNAMLVGVGGSGKQSLTRLAAFISGHYLFQITITKTYRQGLGLQHGPGDYRCMLPISCTAAPRLDSL
ncbi:Dnah5 [Symbiodinium pilosum]|uniref:Dnah5 protein n=1 Tax=Symbiodinium pilosum TaxID=2952 RepID=A0A812VMP6_SYMPI|nr:Dnah5 [Symbiodinium pilosum]